MHVPCLHFFGLHITATGVTPARVFEGFRISFGFGSFIIYNRGDR